MGHHRHTATGGEQSEQPTCTRREVREEHPLLPDPAGRLHDGARYAGRCRQGGGFLPAVTLQGSSGQSRGVGRPRPRRREFEDPSEDRAIRLVRPGQIADTHQEFPDDLPTGEAKCSAKELRPCLRRAWVMRVQPAGERPVRLPQRQESSGIFGGGFDLEPIADDPRISEQAVDLGGAEGGDAIDREISISSAKRRAFLEDCRPG